VPLPLSEHLNMIYFKYIHT